MADYDDAESPVDEPAGRSRSSTRAGGPIAGAWGWFSKQPAQNKVIIVGVIAVLGVVVWMAFRKKTPSADTTTNGTVSDSSKQNKDLIPPLPASPAPPTSIFGSPAGVPSDFGVHNMPDRGARPPTQAAPPMPDYPVAAPAVARWAITPGGMSRAYAPYELSGHRQDISITGSLN